MEQKYRWLWVYFYSNYAVNHYEWQTLSSNEYEIEPLCRFYRLSDRELESFPGIFIDEAAAAKDVYHFA